jgi:hypothetical protein
MVNININLSNRGIYSIIAFGIMMVLGVGTYAYGTSNPSDFGHSIGELEPPVGCSSGQILEWGGASWNCINNGPVINYLVNGQHTYDQCSAAGGLVVGDGSGNYMCKFSASSCPAASAWVQYEGWSAANEVSKDYVHEGCTNAGGCSTNTQQCTAPGYLWNNKVSMVYICSGMQETYSSWWGSGVNCGGTSNACSGATSATVSADLYEIGCY